MKNYLTVIDFYYIFFFYATPVILSACLSDLRLQKLL